MSWSFMLDFVRFGWLGVVCGCCFFCVQVSPANNSVGSESQTCQYSIIVTRYPINPGS